MDEKQNRGEWNSSLSFLIAMIGAAVGLGNIWRFSYVLYDNGGGAFFIPYIIAILIMGIPFLILEYGLGCKFKATLSKILYNIKPHLEILGWFTSFLVFLVLTYYTCIMGWDVIYFLLSFFKGWGSDPNNFFTRTLLHSTSSPYGLTYLVVPIGVVLVGIWALIYNISHKNLNDGIAKATKIFLPLLIILMAGIVVYSLQLPGAWTGLSQLYKPDWGALLNIKIWLAAFGQIVFSLSIGQAIAVTYASYLPKNSKLTDNVLFVVMSNSGFEIFVSIGVFAILGFMSLTNGVAINSLITEGTGLIFIVFPTFFNILGNWAYLIGPIFFLCIFFAGITSAIAFIEPMSASISEKFGWSRKKSVKTLSIIGLIISLIFATGMGNYLLGIADAFINQFGILLAVLLQALVIAWVYGVDKLITVLNANSFIKVGKKWIILIKFVIPILLTFMWVYGICDLFAGEDLKTLTIQLIIVCIFVIVPLVLSLLPGKTDNFKENYFDEDKGKEGINYFNNNNNNNSDNPKIFDNEGGFVNPYKNKKKHKRRNKKDDDKNVLKNVDLSSKAFDSISDDEEDSDNSSNDEMIINDENIGHGGIATGSDLGSSEDSVDSSSKKDEESKDSKDSKFGISNFKKSLAIGDKNPLSSALSSIKDIKDKNLDKLKKSGSPDDAEEYFDDLFDEEVTFDSTNNSTEDLAMGLDTNSKDQNAKDIMDDKSNDKNTKNESKKSKSSKTNNTKNESKKSESSKTKNIDEEKIIYDDFKEDFFDDDIFGDEGYESLLDDYVSNKKKSKEINEVNYSNNSNSSTKSNSKSIPKRLNKKLSETNDSESKTNSKGKKPVFSKKKKINSSDENYNYEGKGIDSVFNLDDD